MDGEEDLIFGKIDVALNEVKRTEIKKLTSYPAFILYSKGEKKKQGETYHPMGSKVPGLEQKDEDINEEHLMTFIQKVLQKGKDKKKTTKRPKN